MSIFSFNIIIKINLKASCSIIEEKILPNYKQQVKNIEIESNLTSNDYKIFNYLKKVFSFSKLNN